jgi:hypothetical protein
MELRVVSQVAESENVRRAQVLRTTTSVCSIILPARASSMDWTCA